ncbi:MAG: extracellular solute-binding protein [Chloroflexi bacterium]|nr:extracellular solute-binding protein [Chloroflexota bacterium]
MPTKDWTHDDYADAMVRLTRTEGSDVVQWGAGIPMWSWDRFWYRVDMWGGHVVDPKDSTKCLLYEKPAIEAMDWPRRLEWDRRVLAQPGELKRLWDSDSISRNFYAQRIAMIEDGFYPYEVARNVETKFRFMWMHVPKGPALRRVLGTSDGFTIWKGTKYPDAAWKLVKWLSGKEFQRVQTGIRRKAARAVLCPGRVEEDRNDEASDAGRGERRRRFGGDGDGLSAGPRVLQEATRGARRHRACAHQAVSRWQHANLDPEGSGRAGDSRATIDRSRGGGRRHIRPQDRDS